MVTTDILLGAILAATAFLIATIEQQRPENVGKSAKWHTGIMAAVIVASLAVGSAIVRLLDWLLK